MNSYNKNLLIDLLDPSTIKALMSIYQIRLKHIAVRLNGVSKQAVKYHLDRGSFKAWQKEVILDLFIDHGLEAAELILINTMTNKKVKK
jgi:hypothetical protein